MELTDDELVRRIKNGDERAFECLIRSYGGLIKAIVKYHLGNISMWQEDCANEILFLIWKNISRFDPSKNTLKNWIGAVSKYRCIDYKRKYYNEKFSELDENIPYEGTAEANILKKELNEEIDSLLSALTPEDREIFIRRYIFDESAAAISAEKGWETSRVYNRLSRGRMRLRKIYGGKWSGHNEE